MPHSIILCTICLNEMEWLPRLYAQHKDWPGLVKWIIIESADINYAKINPDRVSKQGLSVDGTTAFLQEISSKDESIVYCAYGLSGKNYLKDQAKCEARTEYLRIADEYKPDLLVVLDADEFYTRACQSTISEVLALTRMSRRKYKGSAFCFNQRHIWFPPYTQRNTNSGYKLFSHEVVGGYWDVIHCRIWKWEKGLRYKQNHNWPEDDRGSLLVYKNESMLRCNVRVPPSLIDYVKQGLRLPQCIHMGYASRAIDRRAKHQYYIDRGEGSEPDITLRKRRMGYVDCRNAWYSWEPNSTLPHSAIVRPYTDRIPEVFIE